MQLMYNSLSVTLTQNVTFHCQFSKHNPQLIHVNSLIKKRHAVKSVRSNNTMLLDHPRIKSQTYATHHEWNKLHLNIK